jgi:hypothetical protein
MSRLAILFRNLGKTEKMEPQEVVDRFSQYYKPLERMDTFHKSDSFTGMVSQGKVAFTDKDGMYSPKSERLIPLKAQTNDLKLLLEDFNKYTGKYPGIYANNPTSASRAKLYRKYGGFVGEASQYADKRGIPESDLPYTKALDRLMLQGDSPLVDRSNISPSIYNNGYVVNMNRLSNRGTLEDTFDSRFLQKESEYNKQTKRYDRQDKKRNNFMEEIKGSIQGLSNDDIVDFLNNERMATEQTRNLNSVREQFPQYRNLLSNTTIDIGNSNYLEFDNNLSARIYQWRASNPF